MFSSRKDWQYKHFGCPTLENLKFFNVFQSGTSKAGQYKHFGCPTLENLRFFFNGFWQKSVTAQAFSIIFSISRLIFKENHHVFVCESIASQSLHPNARFDSHLTHAESNASQMVWARLWFDSQLTHASSNPLSYAGFRGAPCRPPQ